jgi:hypothetical protein
MRRVTPLVYISASDWTRISYFFLTGLVFRYSPRVLHFILGESPSSADQADMRGDRRYSNDDSVIGHHG